MKRRHKIYIMIALALCLAAGIAIGTVCIQRANAHRQQLIAQIEQSCNAALALEYSNEEAYAQTLQNLTAAKQLLNEYEFKDESIHTLMRRADTHIAALTENPLLNYNLAQLESIIADTLNGAQGNWSVYFEIPGTDFQIEQNNRAVNAASTIKLFNMITLYDEIRKGNLTMTDALAAQTHAMITVSSNPDSNAVATAIGGGSFHTGAGKVTALAHTLGAADTQEQHMLYDEKTVTPGRNTTSVRDCATVLRKLYFGQCVSPEYDAEMLELLKQQTRRFKIPLYLPEGTVVAHKTGENSSVELDVGIVYSPNCDYILCVSVTDFGNAAVRHTIGELSEKIYTYLN